MKLASKVFLILGAVADVFIFIFGIIYAVISGMKEMIYQEVTGKYYSQYTEAQLRELADATSTIILILGLIMIIIGIIGFIFAIITVTKLSKATNKKQIIVPAIFSLIFSCFIGGLLTLLIPQEDFDEGKKEVFAKASEDSASDITERLKKLDELEKNGTITKEEKEKIKLKILDKYTK
ncbi:MAG: hypothetical protein IAC58_00970 [Firmicutes bacterium]|uniref:Uncharacterized protein n=1 Tax=Candidatus Onthovivens merdipullorum TaxID=2840889 RepID=A0A9D9DJ63_9BACL|nr:hypothetical protein [Candidatus Onthovivens merdipullorum]